MKKFLLALLSVMLFSSVSCGAVSDDVYVRKDVFDLEMRNINSNLEKIITKLDKLDNTVNELSKVVISLSARVDGIDKRLDGLDKRIDALDKKIDTVNDNLNKRIDGLDKKIDTVNDNLNKKIDNFNENLNKKIEGVESNVGKQIESVNQRISDVHNFVYWLLVLFAAIVLLPFVSKIWEEHKAKTQSFTIDDVKTLIAQAITEAQLGVKSKA